MKKLIYILALISYTVFAGDIHVAAGKADLEKVIALVKENQKIVNEPFSSGMTPMMFAARTNSPVSVKVAEYLLANGADPNIKSTMGSTALHLACSSHNADFVELLCKNKADVNIKDNSGATALHWALRKVGKREDVSKVVAILIEYHIDANATDNSNASALDYAKSLGDEDLVALLKKNGATKSRIP
jgi:ankyrin repeat protein